MRPPGRVSSTARASSRRCRAASDRDVRFALEPGDVGMAADGAGRRAGRVEQHGVERLRLPFRDVGDDGFGCEPEPRQVLLQSFEPRCGAVDRGDARAGGRELRGLAARRGAEVGDRFAAHVAEQLRRQRRGGVLHPPRAVGVARQSRHRPVHDGAHRSGRQHLPAERFAQCAGSDFTEMSSAGSWPLAAAMACASSAP